MKKEYKTPELEMVLFETENKVMVNGDLDSISDPGFDDDSPAGDAPFTFEMPGIE